MVVGARQGSGVAIKADGKCDWRMQTRDMQWLKVQNGTNKLSCIRIYAFATTCTANRQVLQYGVVHGRSIALCSYQVLRLDNCDQVLMEESEILS